VSPLDASILIAGGLLAGIVNTLAGGGSMLTVPLLVLLGLPGALANGTNRVGIVVQNAVATWGFRRQGISGIRAAIPVLIPVALGSLVGAFAISRVSSELFERLFGLVMLILLVPTLRRAAPRAEPGADRPSRSRLVASLLFFAIGLYGGAFQAGVGILLVFAISYAGYDLVRTNSIKVVVIFATTLVAVPVFIAAHQVAWAPALVLAVGFAAGGELGSRIAVRGGERVIRPVLAVAVLALAGRMFGLY
jgi:uncharacterized membrane protein YfcA